MSELPNRKNSYRIDELAARLEGDLVGEGGVEVSGLAPLSEATSQELSFFGDERYRKELESTGAGAILTREHVEHFVIPQILTPDPFLAMNVLVELFHPPEETPTGVHPLALVSEEADIDASAAVLPFACVLAGASVGPRSVIHPGAYVGRRARVGADCILWTNVVVQEDCILGSRVIVHPGAVIGGDGFGFARRDEKFIKIRHVGVVILEDDVEVGANAAIDRGTLGRTVIGKGVKLDNLVHIGHNVRVGEDTVMAAQVGISGSTVIGKRVMMGGQVGATDHLTIGDDALFIAQSGVIGDIPAGSKVSGYPARSHREVLKAQAEMQHLTQLRRRVKALEEEIRTLKPDVPPGQD